MDSLIFKEGKGSSSTHSFDKIIPCFRRASLSRETNRKSKIIQNYIDLRIITCLRKYEVPAERILVCNAIEKLMGHDMHS